MKMILRLLLLLVLFGVKSHINAQVGKSGNGFIIEGTVSGSTDDTLVLSYYSPKATIDDSAEVVNGKFRFEGSVPSPVRARLYFSRDRNQAVNFYLENSAINIELNIDSLDLSKVSGSVSNDDADSISKMMDRYYAALNALITISDFAMENEMTVQNHVKAIRGQLLLTQRKLIVQYALSHPDSYAVSGWLFINFTNNQTELSLLEKVYENFSQSVRHSYAGKSIEDLITRMKRVEIGSPAPDFTLPDQNGKEVSFSSFRGKYVLLDFWASWCKPCREESPNLVRAYEKYKDKNFVIVGVSLDVEKDRQEWLNAISSDGMSWPNLSSLKGYEEEGVRQLYSVQGIPDNFLIGPDGKIIARGLRGEQIEKNLAKLLK